MAQVSSLWPSATEVVRSSQRAVGRPGPAALEAPQGVGPRMHLRMAGPQLLRPPGWVYLRMEAPVGALGLRIPRPKPSRGRRLWKQGGPEKGAKALHCGSKKDSEHISKLKPSIAAICPFS